METEKNNLASTLADVDAREAGARNQYRATVAQLAEQIQARRAAEAQAAAARASLNAQIKQYQEASDQALFERIKAIVGKKPTKDTFEEAIDTYHTVKGGTREDAINWLNSNNISYTEPKYIELPKSGPVNKNTPIFGTDIITGGRYIYTDEKGNRIL
jgi:hypothetical protein